MVKTAERIYSYKSKADFVQNKIWSFKTNLKLKLFLLSWKIKKRLVIKS